MKPEKGMEASQHAWLGQLGMETCLPSRRGRFGDV